MTSSLLSCPLRVYPVPLPGHFDKLKLKSFPKRPSLSSGVMLQWVMGDKSGGPELDGWVSPAKRWGGAIGFGKVPSLSLASLDRLGNGWHLPIFQVRTPRHLARGEAMGPEHVRTRLLGADLPSLGNHPPVSGNIKAQSLQQVQWACEVGFRVRNPGMGAQLCDRGVSSSTPISDVRTECHHLCLGCWARGAWHVGCGSAL